MKLHKQTYSKHFVRRLQSKLDKRIDLLEDRIGDAMRLARRSDGRLHTQPVCSNDHVMLGSEDEMTMPLTRDQLREGIMNVLQGRDNWY